MNNNTQWFYLILEILYEQDAFNEDWIEIQQFLRPHYESSTDKDNEYRRIVLACQRLKEVGFVIFEPTVALGTAAGNPATTQTLYNSTVRAKMKVEGQDYMTKLSREKKLDKSTLDANNAAIKANTSIESLNTKTGDFYDHQKKYNKGQIGLAAAICLSTIVSVIVSTCSYLHTVKEDAMILEDKKAHMQQLQDMKDSILQDKQNNTNLFRQIKDSLKIP